MTLDTIDFDLKDDDEYPTDLALEAIQNFQYQDGVHEWFRLIKATWHNADWGWFEKEDTDDFDNPVKIYRISTGGWSGNEEIIHYMQKNYILWTSSWYESRRGGHYTFYVRLDKQ